MAIIDSSNFKILSSRTILNILSSAKVQNNKNYPHIRFRYFDIEKITESKVLIIVKPTYSSNIEKIYDDIAKLFSIDVLLNKRKIIVSSENSNIIGINFALDLKQQSKNIKILLKSTNSPIKQKLPELLRPGVLNEEYFTSVINDAVEKLNDAKNQVRLPKVFNPRLLLGINEKNRKRDIIGPIISIKRVGQELEKTDVRIKTGNNKDINISLKKENFSFWSSASKYDAAKNIMDHLIMTNQIEILKNSSGKPELQEKDSGKKITGIKLPATVGEIKKYCFGENGKKIDYILINSYNPGDFKEVRKTGKSGEDYILELNSNIVYTPASNDVIRMRDDVYLTIVPSSSNSSSLMPEYPGFRVQFENKRSSSKFFVPNIKGSSLKRI